MSHPDAELLASIEAIYDTVLDASRWGEALDRTAARAGAYGSMLMVSDGLIDALQIQATSSRIAPHDARSYLQSQLSDEELRWDRALDDVPALTVLHDTAIWPDRAGYEAMPSVAWLHEWKLHHRSAVRLCDHGGWKGTIATLYPEGRGVMTAREERELAPLLPHLARATEIRRPFTLLKMRYRAILTMLDKLGIGVVVLLDDDHILLANDEAERILEAADGLRRRSDGRLGMATNRDEALPRAIHEVRSGANADGATVYLQRGPDHEPYVVDVVAFRESGAELGEALAGVLVCIIDPEHHALISTRGLARVYGLTDAEAQVCALLGDGRSAREIAEIRGVSLDTVKSQRKAILRKTRCADRLALVRRAQSIAPPLLDGRGRREDA